MQHKPRIALIVSHPIQHFCPQYVSFARIGEIEFKVFFASALGYKKYIDPNFKKEISWSNLQLDKFEHVFLNGEIIIQPDKNLDAPALEPELQKYQPDIIITYGYFQKLQRRAHAWATRQNVLIAYISDSEMRQKRNRFTEFIKAVFIKKYFSKISYFLSVGNANEAFYQKMGVQERQLVRMHFPIDVECYRKSFEQKKVLRESIRKQYSIGEGDIVLSVVGKLAPWKNQDHIIDALKLLEAEGKYFHLFVLGSGEMLEQWQQKAAVLLHSKVHFTGFVDIEKLPAYYAASDIYVHPASVEPHSIAVSEAIYMGCPVIISDRCGSYGETDDVQVEKNGLVFQFGNMDSLAASIKELADNKNKREAFAAYAHQIAMQFQDTAHGGVISELIKRIQSGTTNNN